MTTRVMTFDFHNTLAECHEWFDLEVRRLPSSFLSRWSEVTDQEIDSRESAQADEHYRTLRQEIMKHGNELSAEACLHAVFLSMDLRIPDSDISTGVNELMHNALATTHPIPGAVETIRDLHAAGVRLGVVSSAVYHSFLEWTLDMFGISSAFSTVVTSASAGFYKSRPEIYQHAADQMGVVPDQIVHVGDSLRFDVGGASRAGLGTVWLQHRERREDELDYSPDLILTTLDSSSPALLGLLERRAFQRSSQLV